MNIKEDVEGGERLLTLEEVSGIIGGRQGGRSIRPRTVGRWMIDGTEGNRKGTLCRLEYIRMGRQLYSTRSAVARFVAALANAGEKGPAEVAPGPAE